MTDLGVLNLLFDKTFLATSAAAILAFATIATLGLPLIERDGLGQRLKSVSRRREELRAKHHAALNAKRVNLRVAPSAMMKSTLDRFKLTNMLESEDTRDKLAQAGYRGQAPLIAFMFFRFVMPGIVFLVALFYLFVVTHFQYPVMVKISIAVASALFGYYLPDLFISNATARRRQSIMRAFPDALDLMLICVESGMSIESAFGRVSAEIGTQSVELAEELGLTTAELSYLPDRAQAFDNLARRCGHPGVKSVAIALNQAEKYGTPMGQALRITAQENREMRMQFAEQKAASLPAKLTVPMIIFFLPCLFVVILGPAAMKALHLVQ
ncbi:MAG: type II secretion system F family protein [Alphaproteobacteria bacterium]|nr:type II secretion system F family protein [Alphaproteobacteria bacterium]